MCKLSLQQQQVFHTSLHPASPFQVGDKAFVHDAESFLLKLKLHQVEAV